MLLQRKASSSEAASRCAAWRPCRGRDDTRAQSTRVPPCTAKSAASGGTRHAVWRRHHWYNSTPPLCHPIPTACILGDEAGVIRLLRQGLDPNFQDHKGESALHWAGIVHLCSVSNSLIIQFSSTWKYWYRTPVARGRRKPQHYGQAKCIATAYCRRYWSGGGNAHATQWR